jgi:hypothetical protein
MRTRIPGVWHPFIYDLSRASEFTCRRIRRHRNFPLHLTTWSSLDLIYNIGTYHIIVGKENIANAVLRTLGEQLLAQRQAHTKELTFHVSMLVAEDRCAARVSADNPLEWNV